MEKVSKAAHHYTKSFDQAHQTSWHANIGLFFFVWPFTTYTAFQLHIIDMSNVGPSYHFHKRRCISLNECLSTMKFEHAMMLHHDRKSYMLTGLTEERRRDILYQQPAGRSPWLERWMCHEPNKYLGPVGRLHTAHCSLLLRTP